MDNFFYKTRWVFLFFILFAYPSLSEAKDLSLVYQEVQQLKQAKKYLEASQLLKQLIQQNPKNLDWKLELCTLNRWQKLELEAQSCYAEILSSHPNFYDAQMGMAYLERSKNNSVAARTWAERAHQNNPTSTEALLFLGNLELQDNQAEKSKIYYQEVLRQEPNNPEAKEGLKSAELNLKDPLTAVDRTHFDILAPAKKHWRFDFGAGAMKFNFTSTAPTIFFQTYYNNPKKYFILGRFDYLNKFANKTYTTTLGGGYYVHPRVILSDSFAFAPTAFVVPEIQNTFEVSSILPHGVNFYTRYSYRFYQISNVHIITPGVSWYFNEWGIFDVNYSFPIVKIDGLPSTRLDYAVSTRLTFIPIEDRFKFYISYVREQESFDPGNVLEFDEYQSNHVGGGFEWVMTHGVGLRFDGDYENRNNGQTVQTYTSSLFYQF